MKLFGHGKQRLRQERQLGRLHRKLAGSRAEQRAVNANGVPDIQHLIELEIPLAKQIDLDVNLQPFPALLQVHEAGLALAADRLNTTADANRNFLRLQFLRRLRREAGHDLGHRMREVEPGAVRQVAESFQFMGAAETLC